jgi:hypothetical protein
VPNSKARQKCLVQSGSVDWADPFIRARLQHQLAPGQEILFLELTPSLTEVL